MTVTATSLRAQFPEFANTTTFPDSLITSWLAQAVKLVSQAAWDDSTDFGVSLWTAHQLVLSAKAQASAARRSGSPGGATGVLTSKSAGGVSAGYDFSSVAEKGAGFWNQTTYGMQFYRLSQMFGAGPIQVGTDGGVVTTSGFPGPTF